MVLSHYPCGGKPTFNRKFLIEGFLCAFFQARTGLHFCLERSSSLLLQHIFWYYQSQSICFDFLKPQWLWNGGRNARKAQNNKLYLQEVYQRDSGIFFRSLSGSKLHIGLKKLERSTLLRLLGLRLKDVCCVWRYRSSVPTSSRVTLSCTISCLI